MQRDIDRVLIDRHTIAQRVEQLAGVITADLNPPVDGGGASQQAAEITLVPILSGSFMFVADLIRHLPLPMQIRMLSISSYPHAATRSQGPKVQTQLTGLPDEPQTLRGAHVLLIDDILDSGNTLTLATALLKEKNPDSLRTCVLLRKQRPQAMKVPVDYVAFDIPDEFVVGYGLDFNDYYRNLPDIVTLRPHVIEAAQTQSA